ncbi:unnamed protein product [Paramecium octaurelia]|uniref:Uncharacterized protein n=1 Tax=Paramecium octaurelia TaxID=43137 RepID=A0A8S1TS92_PAROT|nr:unnamed protein product [Paramecium octaurelia]
MQQIGQQQQSFQCSIISQNPIPKRYRWNIPMELDESNSMLLLSEELIMRVFQFNSQMILKQIQVIRHNKTTVFKFFHKKREQFREQFVSGSQDSSIMIWSKQLISQAKYIQKCKGHVQGTIIILFNNSNTLIVSAGNDQQIKFWTLGKLGGVGQMSGKTDQQWCCQQTLGVNIMIIALSLNDSGNKLISCSQNKDIFVIQKSQTTQIWIMIQTIKIEFPVRQLQFLNNDDFIFLPYNGKQLYVYRPNSVHNYTKQIHFSVNLGSQCQNINPFYSKIKNRLVFQENRSLCFFQIKANKKLSTKKKENLEIEQLQKIDITRDYCKAILSQDGQYLVLLGSFSSEIIVVQFLEK